MKYERNFLKCNVCGNVIEKLYDSGVTPFCDNEKMEQLKPNTSDGAGEKHVPYAKLDGDKLHVQIGEVEHPMLQEHHIVWIAVAQGGKTQRVDLDPLGKPVADFIVDSSKPMTIYEYCNLHGLWATDFN